MFELLFYAACVAFAVYIWKRVDAERDQEADEASPVDRMGRTQDEAETIGAERPE